MFRQSTLRGPTVSDTVVALGQEINGLKDRVEFTDRQLVKLEQRMAALSHAADSSRAAFELNRIGGSVAEIQIKVSNIEQVVMITRPKPLGSLSCAKTWT